METVIPVSCAFSSTVIIPPSATHQLAFPIFGLIISHVSSSHFPLVPQILDSLPIFLLELFFFSI